MSPTRAGTTVPKRIAHGPGGELRSADAIALLITEGHPAHVVVHSGGRRDPRAAVDCRDAGPMLRERRDNS